MYGKSVNKSCSLRNYSFQGHLFKRVLKVIYLYGNVQVKATPDKKKIMYSNLRKSYLGPSSPWHRPY